MKAISGGLAVAIAAIVLAACGNGAATISSTGSTGSVAQGSSGPASTTTTTDAASALAVVGQGFTQLAPDSIGNSYANEAAVLKWNGSDSVAEEVEVTLTLTDASGTVVNSDQETVGAIFPDETVAVSHEAQVSGAVNIRVQAIVTNTEHYSESPPQLTATGVNTTNDGYIQTTTGSLASSATKQLQNVQAVAVYYNSANAVVGGDSTFVNFIPAAGNTSFQITGTNVIPGLASTQVYANVSNLTLSTLSS